MFRLIFAAPLALLTVSNAWGIGLESFGNRPFTHHNYEDWPNVLPVINDTHRVYHSWVNGNEHFYFAGDTNAMNAALKNSAAIDADGLKIVLRPGPGKSGSFNSEQTFAFDWMVHLRGGIARAMSRRELGSSIWDPSPYLHVYDGQAIKLNEIEIPDGVEVFEIADLQNRYIKGLTSNNRTVRGWSCGHIARLNPYDADTMRKIAALLNDHDNWVKLNAAGALSVSTGVAREAIERLQAIKTDDEKLQKRISQSIDTLQKSEPNETVRKKLLAVA